MKNVRAGPPRQGPKLFMHSSEIFQPWLPSTRVTKVMADNLVPDFPEKKLHIRFDREGFIAKVLKLTKDKPDYID